MMPLDAEEAKNLGSLLRQSRTQKGLSLESVQQRTRIPRKFLEALEENRFEDFPAPVYLRGFLHTYCEFLDMDFDQLWPLTGAGRQAPQPAEKAPEEFPALRLPASALLAALLFGAAVLGGAILWSARRESPPAARPPEALPLVAPVRPAAPPPAHVLLLSFSGRTWLRLQADHEVKFEGRVPSGATQEWHAKEGFLIRTNAPDNVRVLLDGREMALSSLAPDSSGDYALAPPSAASP